MDAIAGAALNRLLERARRDPDVLAVILFGSRARGEASAGSDLDVAIFQQVPLYIRSRVLREGTVLFVRDEEALYGLATRTARAFEDFRHVYREYLDQVARG